jgi:hypothetical protein
LYEFSSRAITFEKMCKLAKGDANITNEPIKKNRVIEVFMNI